MKAVVLQKSPDPVLVLSDVADPVPGPGDALVRVEAFSLNLGEVRRGYTMAAAGWRPGWDFAGTVEQAAADGQGPKAGTRVVGFLEEAAWAERLAVPVRALAALPDVVSTVQAATLPVAGLTALFALERAGPLVGRRVLVSGASGGVGHFALQLARAGGAHVVAAVRRPELAAEAEADGAHTVVDDASLAAAAAHGPFDVILESVGGAALSNALTMLTRAGVCVTFGNSSRTPAPVDAGRFYLTGRPRLEGLYVLSELRHVPPSEGLGRLARLVADGRLKPRITLEAPWTDIERVARALVDRKVAGKAVLTIG
ncbi:zinc-binding dehydrogenase [Pseudoxanthobacter sp. M-2]|uniref:zinc-binding dehydrogenase n=1 Tax=Pseudoxanthobacter sp. M-2 TaxID=3078754 RepID=UPI0038FC92A1